MALRVEADGFAPQVFNWIEKKKGPQDLYFQLEEDKGILGQVQTPDGQPASGATVAIAMVQRDAVVEGKSCGMKAPTCRKNRPTAGAGRGSSRFMRVEAFGCLRKMTRQLRC